MVCGRKPARPSGSRCGRPTGRPIGSSRPWACSCRRRRLGRATIPSGGSAELHRLRKNTRGKERTRPGHPRRAGRQPAASLLSEGRKHRDNRRSAPTSAKFRPPATRVGDGRSIRAAIPSTASPAVAVRRGFFGSHPSAAGWMSRRICRAAPADGRGTSFFLAVKESLNNVVRHSDARGNLLQCAAQTLVEHRHRGRWTHLPPETGAGRRVGQHSQPCRRLGGRLRSKASRAGNPRAARPAAGAPHS